MPQSLIVLATRPTNCLTLRSRAGVPMAPRKYFETTTLVASCDQKLGTSTSFCSNTTSPFSLAMVAERSSQVISSKGWTVGRVQRRGTVSPLEDTEVSLEACSAALTTFIMTILPHI